MAAKALSHQMSRVVHVDRNILLSTLRINREKHIAEFNKAMEGYKAMAAAKLEEAFSGLGRRMAKSKEKILEKIESFSPQTAGEFSDYFILVEQVAVNLKVPVSYAEAYDAAIDMATFETRDVIELSGAEFQCFCRDVWDWSHEFSATNIRYTSVLKNA